jgi:hypothetical protein
VESKYVNTSGQSIDLPTDSLSDEIRTCWRLLPNKGLFFGLIAIWMLLFHFYGNASLGYISSTSLFKWMSVVYNADSDIGDDGHGNFIPLLVLGLMWWKRQELLALSFKTWWPGLLLIAGGLVLHMVGYIVQQQRVSIVGLFTGIYGLTGLVEGDFLSLLPVRLHGAARLVDGKSHVPTAPDGHMDRGTPF